MVGFVFFPCMACFVIMFDHLTMENFSIVYSNPMSQNLSIFLMKVAVSVCHIDGIYLQLI